MIEVSFFSLYNWTRWHLNKIECSLHATCQTLPAYNGNRSICFFATNKCHKFKDLWYPFEMMIHVKRICWLDQCCRPRIMGFLKAIINKLFINFLSEKNVQGLTIDALDVRPKEFILTSPIICILLHLTSLDWSWRRRVLNGVTVIVLSSCGNQYFAWKWSLYHKLNNIYVVKGF